jgi:hypothetical protein
MNVERLHAIAFALREDLNSSEALLLLQNLVSSLSAQISQPNQPQHQQNTSQFFTQLVQALANSQVNSFSPTWRQVLDEIGASRLLGNGLAERIRDTFLRNQITPSVAQQELQTYFNEVQQLFSGVDQMLAGLSALKIEREELAPGECELGVLVPRVFLDNRLDRFASELDELNQIFGVFSEIASGSRPGFPIKTISSSDLSVYLEVGAIVGACIATCIERIVALYKQLLEIRKTQAELAKLGVEKKNLKGLEDHANGVMEKGIEKLVTEVIAEYLPKSDGARNHELSIELKFALKKIANRVDRGFNIEVRMEEPDVDSEDADESTEEEKKLLAAHSKVSNASQNMQFLKLDGDPILQLPESKGSKQRGEA